MPKLEDHVVSEYIREIDKLERESILNYSQYGPAHYLPAIPDDGQRNCTACRQLHRITAKK